LTDALARTPLHALHLELGARMVPFAGYEMPVQYPAGILAEHAACRDSAALFDVSHMGQVLLRGPDAAAALETLVPVDVAGLAVGQQRYALFTNEAGGLLDDLMVVRRQHDLMLVVNAACKAQDVQHLQQHLAARCEVQPLPGRALLALQGPRAVDALARLAPGVAALRFMTGGAFTLAGAETYVTRSGYTGEDGFEISVPDEAAPALARALVAQPEVRPAGLGARDTLRLEAGLCLYGNDIDSSTTPVEAGLGWAIQKVRRSGGARAGGFPGATKIIAQISSGTGATGRKLVGLQALERVPVREHSALQTTDGQPLGEVTSGLLSPTVDAPIALGYVPPAFSTPGTRLQALVRGKPVPMEVVALPFVPHRYVRG
jgi:aminomethyltransferase